MLKQTRLHAAAAAAQSCKQRAVNSRAMALDAAACRDCMIATCCHFAHQIAAGYMSAGGCILHWFSPLAAVVVAAVVHLWLACHALVSDTPDGVHAKVNLRGL